MPFAFLPYPWEPALLLAAAFILAWTNYDDGSPEAENRMTLAGILLLAAFCSAALSAGTA